MKTPRDEVCAMQGGRFLRPFDSPGFFALFAAFNNFKATGKKGFCKKVCIVPFRDVAKENLSGKWQVRLVV